MEFNRQNLLRDHTTATETIELDLPIDPLSHVLIAMDAYNVTDEATLAELLAFVNWVDIARKGVTVFHAQSEDLYAMNCRHFGHYPELTGKLATDNEARNLCLIVPLGRRVFDPTECHPATKRGELVLRINTTVPAASADESTINVECVSLPGATPTAYLKTTEYVIGAPAGTGNNFIDLPLGNKIVRVQLRLTTIPTTSSHTYGVDLATVLVDNNESGYVSARAQCLQADHGLVIDHQHGSIAAQGVDQIDNVVWLDFDPVNDGQFLLDTEGHESVQLRLEMGVAEATTALIHELVTAG